MKLDKDLILNGVLDLVACESSTRDCWLSSPALVTLLKRRYYLDGFNLSTGGVSNALLKNEEVKLSVAQGNLSGVF